MLMIESIFQTPSSCVTYINYNHDTSELEVSFISNTSRIYAYKISTEEIIQ